MSNKIDILRTYLKYKNMRFKDRAALEKYQEKKISKQLDFVTSHSRLYEKYKGNWKLLNQRFGLDRVCTFAG